MLMIAPSSTITSVVLRPAQTDYSLVRSVILVNLSNQGNPNPIFFILKS